jgi:SAM-dependent methyltransferase
MDEYYKSVTYLPHNDQRRGLIAQLYYMVRRYMLGRKAQMIEKISRLQTGKLIDIGAGTGHFAAAMQQRGWQVVAVEKNESARMIARDKFGLDIRPPESLDECAHQSSYDVVTLWHVMEHLEDLNKAWTQAYDLLTPNGLLVVAVPNAASYDAARLKHYWAAYDVPRHLWHFTPDTIQQMAFKYGFLMTARHPMPFDAFYIAMLSRRNQRYRFPVISGFVIGFSAWLRSLVKREKSSSMVYIFRKKAK